MKVSTRVATPTLRRGGLRRSVALAVVACGAALLITPAVAAAEPGDEVVDHITIVQTPSETQGDCQPALLALSNKVESTPTTFVLTVTASAPLCDPIEATAAIYGMPGNGVAWPQQLLESKKFTIAEAGVTVITFSKDCTPAQFDVINGVTPQTINTPLDHGPLLFPLDTNTARQYWGCSTTTSTTTTESTTTTTSTTSSTVPPQVLGTTTIAPALGATSTSTPPQAAAVAAATATRPAGAALALTGSRTTPTAIAGVALVLIGGVLFLAARRRRVDEA